MKIVIELDSKLRENDLLICKNGKLSGITLRELLPDYKELKNKLSDTEGKMDKMAKEIKHLKGED